jgi:hypothetical protein
MAIVRNPGPHTHRVGRFWFPVGGDVEVNDPAVLKYVVEKMGFEQVNAPKPISDGAPVTKPAQGKKK